MRNIRPDFFDSFKCLASACTDTCCAGWEIDIDDDTAEIYRGIKGEFGKRLRKNISTSPDGNCCFELTASGRCPFLNQNNLCDIIINCGEDCISDICRLHPRFFHFFYDSTELGLGLCCEAAAALLLGDTKPLGFITEEDSEPSEEAEEAERDLTAAVRRASYSIRETVNNRSLTLAQRIVLVLKSAQAFQKEIFNKDYEKLPELISDFELLNELKKTEPINDKWVPYIDSLIENLPDILKSEPDYLKAHPENEALNERVLCYLLYRHLPGCMDDGDFYGRVRLSASLMRFCALSDAAVFHKKGTVELRDRADNLKRMSQQIEYSDINPVLLQKVL